MGACASCTRGSFSKFQCEFCSKNTNNTSKKPIQCPNGHMVCKSCMIKTQIQYRCPQCKTTISQIQLQKFEKNQLQEEFAKNKHELSFPKSKNVLQQENQHSQHYNILNEQTNFPYEKNDQIQSRFRDDVKIQQLIRKEPIKQDLVKQLKENSNRHNKKKADQLNAPQSQNKAQDDEKQKKIVFGCSKANFMVFNALLIQTLFTAVSVMYSFAQPRSQCMDVAHLHPLLIYRSLMQQISGIESVLATIVGISALVYKSGYLSDRIFDNWMMFLKLVLGMKQLAWAALQAFMQVAIMPLYCSQGIMRFALASTVANIVTFLLVIIRPVYICICSRSS